MDPLIRDDMIHSVDQTLVFYGKKLDKAAGILAQRSAKIRSAGREARPDDLHRTGKVCA